MVAQDNDFLTVRSIKRQVDGALGSHGAWLLAPYADLPSTAGLVLEPIEEIMGTARLAIEHGYQLNTHAIGDRANREILDLYERAFSFAGFLGRPYGGALNMLSMSIPLTSDGLPTLELSQHSKVFTVPRMALGSHCGLVSSVAFKPLSVAGFDRQRCCAGERYRCASRAY